MAVPVLTGLGAGGALLALSFGLVSAANSPGHAVNLLWGDRYFVAAITMGLAIQVGLYAHVRRLRAQARALSSSAALATAGTGTSTAAMIACCAHHVTDVLPLLGLSGAAILLQEYRATIMLAGLSVNALGIAVMLQLVRNSRRELRSVARG